MMPFLSGICGLVSDKARVVLFTKPSMAPLSPKLIFCLAFYCLIEVLLELGYLSDLFQEPFTTSSLDYLNKY